LEKCLETGLEMRPETASGLENLLETASGLETSPAMVSALALVMVIACASVRARA
jgi:hypothetical protein